MGFLGLVFTKAASDFMQDAGMEEGNVFENLVSHASNLGNFSPPPARGIGLGGSR